VLGFRSSAIANESTFIKRTLNTDESKIKDFIRGYLVSRFDSHGLDWLDALRIRNWSIPLKAELLILIGFFEPVWLKASELLKSKERIYWQSVRVNPHVSADNMEHAVRRLIENGRPFGAVQCLFVMIQRQAAVDIDLLIQALSRLGATEERESPDPMSAHYIAKLVEHLQERDDVPDTDKAMIEWTMLPVIEDSREVVPKYLEMKLATEADFYSEVIRLIFRSKKEPAPAKVKESDQRKAANAYRLLRTWRTPPGTVSDTEFNDNLFRQWLKEMVRSCEESGHLDVALSQLGQVLIHAPEDANGLWINKTVAEALDGNKFARLRHGFVIGELNSRGAHIVDPTGKPEFELAEKYLGRSAEVELEGYPRFAEALRNLADDYQRQGERIVREHLPDNSHDDDA
jgi:hypothetical protein